MGSFADHLETGWEWHVSQSHVCLCYCCRFCRRCLKLSHHGMHRWSISSCTISLCLPQLTFLVKNEQSPCGTTCQLCLALDLLAVRQLAHFSLKMFLVCRFLFIGHNILHVNFTHFQVVKPFTFSTWQLRSSFCARWRCCRFRLRRGNAPIMRRSRRCPSTRLFYFVQFIVNFTLAID